MKEELDKLNLRITELENQLKQSGVQPNIDPEEMKVFRKVLGQMGGSTGDLSTVGCILGQCGVCITSCINVCRLCTCVTCRVCSTCVSCRTCTTCVVCRVCTTCINECSCGPCGGRVTGYEGINQFEDLGM